MEPAISTGDLIVITRPPHQIEVGQVLTLEVDGQIVTHRVVEVRPDGSFVTQGDANDSRDDFSGNTVRVVGQLQFSLPLIGALIDPIVSGAWFSDQASAASSASAGLWESPDEFKVFMWSGEGITWVPVSPEPTPAPTPTEDPTPTPTPTEPTATATPSATPTPGISQRPAPSIDVTPIPTPETSPSVEPTPSATPEETPEEAPTETPEAMASPTEMLSPDPSVTPNP